MIECLKNKKNIYEVVFAFSIKLYKQCLTLGLYVPQKNCFVQTCLYGVVCLLALPGLKIIDSGDIFVDVPYVGLQCPTS